LLGAFGNFEMSEPEDPVEVILRKLGKLGDRHLELGKDMTHAYGGVFYGMDLLAYGALNRSKAHLSGFTQLIRNRNLVCAGALLRLQLDTAMRFAAAWQVQDPHEFALAVLSGKRVRDLKDQAGRKLTDAHLVALLGAEFAWVPRVYEATSGYVHLSSVHLHSAITAVDGEGDRQTFEMKISEIDKEMPADTYIEAIEAFAASTEILLQYVVGWIYTKSNPEAVAAAKRERDLKPSSGT